MVFTKQTASNTVIDNFYEKFPDKLTEEEKRGIILRTRRKLFIREINERNLSKDNVLPISGQVIYWNGEWHAYTNDGHFISTFNIDVIKFYVCLKHFINQQYSY